ncbi:hypothetical protein B0H13DRAFT_1997140 [Mycena leptocephala]|nr:hypothetical protein B0H13DRAFT_1997140 [Mycena leptocephala]
MKRHRRPIELKLLWMGGRKFIYDLYRSSGLPWVYGGQYAAFGKIVTAVVNAWVSVGFTIYFVFDGACPGLKFPTLVSRLAQSNISHSLIFFRTSAASRSSPRFLNESRIIPPLSYTACLDALKAICQTTDTVSIHYADEEGDPYAVELAGRLGAFVVGTDSDFVILNSEGYRGYIPLDEMVWNIPTTSEPTVVEDDDFQQVRKPKTRKKVSHDSRVTSNLPVTLLPLFGALVGNDFSNQSASTRRNVQLLFFERQLSLTQRINRVAATMHSILSASAQKGKQKQVEGVMDLIDRTVNALLVRSISSMGSGEVEAIVERIVVATLQFWPTDICALHEADVCPILPMFSRLVTAEALLEERENDDELLKRNELRGQYLSAYRDGQLHAKVNLVATTFLETPDLETVSRVLGRPIRQWGYAILHDTDETTSEIDGSTFDEEAEEDDEDELIDVVESDSDDDGKGGADLLAPLRGALQRLHYVRRGTRIAEEQVIVPPISDLLSSISSTDFLPTDATPVLLQPEQDRFTILLRSAGQWGSREREKERWTRKEARCFSPRSLGQLKKPPSGQENIYQKSWIEYPPVNERLPSPASLFSGVDFHACLTGIKAVDVPDTLWDACIDDIAETFGDERKKKPKKPSRRLHCRRGLSETC